MSNSLIKYDCAIIGGGLAGLCLSIQLARLGHKVVLFEKNKYPFHKVCGEYVSNESFGFLLRLGVKLDEWDLPQINRLYISSEKGFLFTARLDLGGFGISRYKLDNELVLLAKENGVNVLDDTKVTDIKDGAVHTNKGNFGAKICVGAFGKANPVFAREENVGASGYIGVKYHVKADLPSDQIGLHNFNGGYCGISKVENDTWCLCYMSHSSTLKECGNSIREMERKVLRKNPHLERLFSTSEFIFPEPVTVSNIRFNARRTYDDRLIYVGDAAGCISPLTGNGMSMSGYSSFILSGLLHQYIGDSITREEMVTAYGSSWNGRFLGRIRRGKQLQYLFGSRHLSDLALRVLNPFEKVKRKLIRSTHGIPF
jgi:menaquinone-9 beta-reductase